ncbi:MAG: response regulator [Bacteroidota bacterium]
MEDDPALCKMIRYMLRHRCQTTIAHTYAEALVALEREAFAAGLVDINLGADRTGLDVLRTVRAQSGWAEMRLLAITAYALPGDASRFLELGFDGYLAKPFTRQALLDHVERLLSRPRPTP